MNKQTSHHAISHWGGMHLEGGRPSDTTTNWFSRAVREFVPEPEAFAGVNLLSGERALLVLQGDSLFVAVASGEDSNVSVEVAREPLDPAAISVRHGRANRGSRRPPGLRPHLDLHALWPAVLGDEDRRHLWLRGQGPSQRIRSPAMRQGRLANPSR